MPTQYHVVQLQLSSLCTWAPATRQATAWKEKIRAELSTVVKTCSDAFSRPGHPSVLPVAVNGQEPPLNESTKWPPRLRPAVTWHSLPTRHCVFCQLQLLSLSTWSTTAIDRASQDGPTSYYSNISTVSFLSWFRFMSMQSILRHHPSSSSYTSSSVFFCLHIQLYPSSERGEEQKKRSANNNRKRVNGPWLCSMVDESSF